MSQQTHRSDPRILSRRTLAADHPRVGPLLRPGMRVLDVGCGTGAITAGMARAVEGGEVLGVDRDEVLVAQARRDHAAERNLHFEVMDVTSLPCGSAFDLVSAARVLQWISEPGRAVSQMRRAAKPGGYVVVLDYNHAANRWDPEPPPEFRRFYSAFLEWRDRNGWDNRMGDHLAGMLAAAGLEEVVEYRDDQETRPHDPDFEEDSALWERVMESIGPAFLTGHEVEAARTAFALYRRTALQRQVLSIRTVQGRVG